MSPSLNAIPHLHNNSGMCGTPFLLNNLFAKTFPDCSGVTDRWIPSTPSPTACKFYFAIRGMIRLGSLSCYGTRYLRQISSLGGFLPGVPCADRPSLTTFLAISSKQCLLRLQRRVGRPRRRLAPVPPASPAPVGWFGFREVVGRPLPSWSAADSCRSPPASRQGEEPAPCPFPQCCLSVAGEPFVGKRRAISAAHHRYDGTGFPVLPRPFGLNPLVIGASFATGCQMKAVLIAFIRGTCPPHVWVYHKCWILANSRGVKECHNLRYPLSPSIFLSLAWFFVTPPRLFGGLGGLQTGWSPVERLDWGRPSPATDPRPGPPWPQFS